MPTRGARVPTLSHPFALARLCSQELTATPHVDTCSHVFTRARAGHPQTRASCSGSGSGDLQTPPRHPRADETAGEGVEELGSGRWGQRESPTPPPPPQSARKGEMPTPPPTRRPLLHPQAALPTETPEVGFISHSFSWWAKLRLQEAKMLVQPRQADPGAPRPTAGPET